MIRDNLVCGGPALNIPVGLSLGQHVLDRLRESSKQCSNLAMINSDNEYSTTYKQLLHNTVNFAAGLIKIGAKPGDVLAILSENGDQFYAAVFGAICCGMTVTTLNCIYTKDEIIHACDLSKPKIFVCSEIAITRHLNTIKSIPCIKTIIQFNGPPKESSVLSFEKVMMETDASEFVPSTRGRDSIAFIMYSSGTTGMPKGVMLTDQNILYILAGLECGYTAEKCFRPLVVVPWYHVLGLIYCISYLTNNKLMVFSQNFQTEKYLSNIQDYKIDILITAPPLVIALSKSPLVVKYDTTSVKVIWCGGAPLGAETTDEVLRRSMPNCLYINQLYGMTETTFGVVKDLDSINNVPKPGSCGYPIPGYNVKIVKIDTRERLGPNSQGEICLKGPSVMKGYIGNERATRDIIDEEGYVKTGDIGYYDNDGCLFVIDRLKELIKYKGFQVSPAAVEKVILQHEGVAECGVVGKPDDFAGELPTAFVVPKAGSNITEEELLQFTSDRLSESASLRGGIIFINEIPKNRSGKILRRKLRERVQNQYCTCKM